MSENNGAEHPLSVGGAAHVANMITHADRSDVHDRSGTGSRKVGSPKSKGGNSGGGRLNAHSNRHDKRSGSGNGGAVVPQNRRRSSERLMGMLNPWGGNNHPLTNLPGALTVSIKTGSQENAGTDARIWMRIHGKSGSMSPVFELERHTRHNFSDGQLFKLNLLAPYPEVSLLEVDEIQHGSGITPLCGDVSAIELWRDDGRDVALDGEDPSWFLSRVTLQEPHTGDHWDFIWNDWVGMTMSERALKAIDSPNDEVDLETSMNRIAACPAGAHIINPMRYDTMRPRKAGGVVNVSNSETELQWWSTKDGVRHFILFATLDRFISVLIILTIVCDVFREEIVVQCVLSGLKYDAAIDSGETPGARNCSWAGSALKLYPWLLAFDLLILFFFLLELLFRFTLKYWGLQNVFANTLKAYNRRYRKLGLEMFKKNGIRRTDPKRSKTPWFMTLYANGNEQFRKEYEDVMESDIHARRRIPYNFLASESMAVIVFEFGVVVAAIFIQIWYIAKSEGTITMSLDGHTMAKIVSIMRIIRVTRIVTRIDKLRALVMALAGAFTGVLWILVLVVVGSYAYAIVGVMVFKIDDPDVGGIEASDECDRDCVVENMDGYFGSLWSACSTLFFNILLGDGISDVTGAGIQGPSGNWIYVYVISYLIICVFLLMEAVTGYIVDIISSKYQDQAAVDALPFAAVARVKVVDWYASLQPKSNNPDATRRSGEQEWLGTWLSDAVKTKKIDITSTAHIHRMLKQVKKYNLEYAQMEFEPEAGGSDFAASDWLIGVRSEAEMSRLLEHGFMYWDKNDPLAPANPKPWAHEREPSDGPIALSIPVIREEQGELIQLTGLRTPSFAVEEHVHDAFLEYGVVLKVERETWDLPEDADNPEEIADMEETLTLLWRVRLYQNEKPFPVLPLGEFDPMPRAQLERRGMLECQAIEIYGQMCPILPERFERPYRAVKAKDDEDDTGLLKIFSRFALSELFEFAQTFTPDEEDHREHIEQALDSIMPKEALIRHLVSPRSILKMIQVPASVPFPNQPMSETHKLIEKTRSSSGPRKTLSQMGWAELMTRVEHYRKKAMIRNEDEAAVDASDNPKETWIDILCQLEHQESKTGAGSGSGWVSKWEELREATENLKTSLYMSCAGIRDCTASELKLRALEDSGVSVDELNAAIAYEFWVRCDNEELDGIVRRELAPQLQAVMNEVNDYFPDVRSRPGSPNASMAESDVGDPPLGEAHAFLLKQFLPFVGMKPEKIPLEMFFFAIDSKTNTQTSEYIERHLFDKHRAVVQAMIDVVRKNSDVLHSSEVLAAEREGALKAILRHFQIGGVTMFQLDKQLEQLSNSARTHSDTMAKFQTSELYELGRKERLHRKFVNYKRDKTHIIELLVDHERKLAASGKSGSFSGKPESVSTQKLQDELDRVHDLSFTELKKEATKVGWVEQQKQDQLTQALDSADPKKVLIWRLLEAAAHPAPAAEIVGLQEVADKGFSLSMTVPVDGWEATERETKELLDHARENQVGDNVVQLLQAAHEKVSKSIAHVRAKVDRDNFRTKPPARLAPWAEQMTKDLDKVHKRSEKLDRHTTKLHDKVAFMSNDLVKILTQHGLEDESSTAQHDGHLTIDEEEEGHGDSE